MKTRSLIFRYLLTFALLISSVSPQVAFATRHKPTLAQIEAAKKEEAAKRKSPMRQIKDF